jgi:hypothetical protein
VASESLGCYKDGVLFQDRGETRLADGITWVAVASPGGAPGWASAQYLDTAGRNMATPPLAHPKGTRTGNAEVDPVLAALETGDPATIESVVSFTPVPCETNPLGIGAPPACKPGMPEGTPIEALPSSCMEGTFILKEEFRSNPDFGLFSLSGVYAVYRQSQSTVATVPPYGPAGSYVAVYRGFAEFSTLVVIDQGKIARVSFCQPRPMDVTKDVPPDNLVLPPPK